MALAWYKRAAEKGHLKAQHQLAMMHRLGRGTEVDNEKMHYWLNRAAENNHPAAFNTLGHLYWAGETVEKDPEMARALFERSARLRADTSLMSA